MSLLLRGGRLVADDRFGGAPVDVLVADAQVAAVVPSGGAARAGVEAGGAREAGRAVETVELGGRWIHPGLWDGHVHSGQASLAARRLDVSRAGSAAEVAALVRARLEEAPPAPGEVLLGFGFRDGLWPDAPDPALLELGDHAVALVSGDVHCLWSNRAALATIGRGPGDWLLREQDAFDANVALARAPDAVLDRWAVEDAAAWAARGVVGIHDFEMHEAPAAWARRAAAGFRGLRVRAAVYPEGLAAARAAGVRTGAAVDGGAGLVTGGRLKLFADGSLNTRTAWCADPYPGIEGPAAHGLPTYGLDELVELARAGIAAGLAPAIHAIGDRAVALALDAFAALGPLPGGARGRIEHAQLVARADLPRFAALGVAASVQPAHLLDDREVAERHWAGRTDRAFPSRSLLDAGAALVLGSDAPVAPLDPWIAIAAAVTRTRDGLPPWHPEQAITAREALAASSGGVARVEAGGAADLVVLDADPLAVPPEALRAMPVAATMVAGEWTHRAL